MWEVPHEAHRVGEGVLEPVRRRRPPGGRVERREQRVLHQHTRAGDGVEQTGLARVGVADQGHARNGVGDPASPLGGPDGVHRRDVLAELGDALVDAPAVGLQLGFTGTTQTHTTVGATGAATGLPRQRQTPPAQSRDQILQLRQLDLGLAFTRTRVLGEDVEDQRGAVDDLHPQLLLQVPQLAGRELTVADDGVGPGRHDDVGELAHLARADVGGGVRPHPALDDALQHLGTRGLGQPREFGQGLLGLLRRPLGPHADEDDALQPQLPVLDLGDVAELGRQPRDPAQRGAVGKFQFALRHVVVERVDGADGIDGVMGSLVCQFCHRLPIVPRFVGKNEPIGCSEAVPPAWRCGGPPEGRRA